MAQEHNTLSCCMRRASSEDLRPMAFKIFPIYHRRCCTYLVLYLTRMHEISSLSCSSWHSFCPKTFEMLGLGALRPHVQTVEGSLHRDHAFTQPSCVRMRH